MMNTLWLSGLRFLSSVLIIVMIILPTPIYALEKGAVLPEIYGSTLENGLFRLSTFFGKEIVLSFFSVKCVPCTKELPELAKLEKAFPNIRFLSVHIGDEDSKTIKMFIEKLPDAPKQIFSAGTMVGKDYHISSLPYTVYAGPDGHVIYDTTGFTDKKMKTLENILSQGKQKTN